MSTTPRDFGALETDNLEHLPARLGGGVALAFDGRATARSPREFLQSVSPPRTVLCPLLPHEFLDLRECVRQSKTMRIAQYLLAATLATAPVAAATLYAAEPAANTITMQNASIKLTLADPTASQPIYTGQRFTLPGMVVDGSWKGIPFLVPFAIPNDYSPDNQVGGTAEEFDLPGPADYDSAAVGGTFMKIGVGILRRDDAELYKFSLPREVVIAPANSIISSGKTSTTFLQTLEDPMGGRGYRLEICVSLREDGFTVRRELANTGKHPLRTEHYTHNFCKIADHPVGPAYEVGWTSPIVEDKVITGGGAMLPTPHGLKFAKPPQGHFYLSGKCSGFPADEPIVVTQRDVGIQLSIATSSPLHRIAVWGTIEVISPEPFVLLEIPPGKSAKWSTTYQLEKLDEKK